MSSAAVEAIQRADLRDVRDELLRRARQAENRAADHVKAGGPMGHLMAADELRMAGTFREAAKLADAKLHGA